MAERAPSAAATILNADSADGRCAERNAKRFRLAEQRRDQMPVLDHMGERLARLYLAGEGEKHRPHRVAKPAVGDDHVEDRLRVAGDAVPHPQRFEQPPRRRDDRRSALVIVVASAERRIGDHDGE
jgi:hypothetical protein